MTDTPTEGPTPQVALYRKLYDVAQAIPFIEKRGRNDHHGYAFAQAVDVTREVRAQLLARGIIVIPSAHNATHLPYTAGRGGSAFLTTVDLAYLFVDTESGGSIEVPWVGVGADTGGDKGVYKAFTGGLKYALLTVFLLPTSDDPEHDALTQTAAPATEAPHPDADRPAAPAIPRDRAYAILNAAVTAKLATAPEGAAPDLGPILRAKLSDVGAESIGTLNVDQAEAVEAFITDELSAQDERDVEEQS